MAFLANLDANLAPFFVMVGEGRPSTLFFCFQYLATSTKPKTRGWSAFADHDEEGGEVRVQIGKKRHTTNGFNGMDSVQ